MKTLLISLIFGFNYFVIIYNGIFNFVYTFLLTVSLFVILRYIKRTRYSAYRDFGFSAETLPVSILMPAHNEEKVIIHTVKSALSINYPCFDVIVINDGSTDKTLENLIDVFRLRKVDNVYRKILNTKPVHGFYYNADIPNLLVIDKERGGKADALNCGICTSRSPYVCTSDADSILEEDALIRIITPVLESNVPIVACGGVIRVLNGARLVDGKVKAIELPKSNLALFQIVEYLRAFLFGRIGWDSMNSLLILSGAFSLFNKAAVIDVGGFKVGNITEDMEIIINLHKYYHRQKKPYRIKFIPDPICWTEVPEELGMLGRQRRRWHLGLMQSILMHKSMMFNPRYGAKGLFLFPYYLIFELLGPFVEVLGYITIPISYFVGLLSFKFLLLFLGLAIFYGIFLSVVGIFLEEITYRRYPKWSQLFKLLIYGALENFGYRQINSFWRFQAIFLYIFGIHKWEYVEKKGPNLKAI